MRVNVLAARASRATSTRVRLRYVRRELARLGVVVAR
jgi:hypothetical protein